ncbi:sulfotransferase domain-containing protein [Roseomonas hellenica]|uniref:Sulfotransferase domain-containing protein n=1 Tax=Plastoroseomonas hellenica TaxID=2687306 RepID=A0ABS5F9L1_9PROT|nr:sulfotransferase [Plastoroseomonas hellenica]MBR0669128.1 sulfotransferase domain-containing protein [Plastoroseomonas hellenica]
MSERVGLFVAGVQKAGTTSLDAYLRLHPALAGPSVKETHFFDDESMTWDAPAYERLHGFYPPFRDETLRFEATPATSFWAPALGRIRRYNPSARIILLLRDPIARAWSHWSMEFHRGAETLPFCDAIRSGRQRFAGAPLGPEWRDYSYVERGLYLGQVRRALMLYPESQLLFLDSQSLLNDAAGTLARIADFAGIAPFPAVPEMRERQNPRHGAAPDPRDVALLKDLFAEDAREAVTLAGIDADHWPTLRADASPSPCI